jgi:glyoxylase-like metal-dependent hydrolase (beta-lactamase superfamily II)
MTAPEQVQHDDLDPRITVFRVGDEVNTFVVRTERFVVLIDTMSTPQLCQAVLDRMAADLVDRPLMVVNTHADWDHVWGNAAVAGRAPIIAHEAAGHRLRGPEAAATLTDKAAAEDRFADVRLVEPTITFQDSLVLRGGDLTLELLHTPGHTPDHVAVWIPELTLCLIGDAAEDPLPEVTNPVPADLRQLRESLRRMRNLEPATVLPSHGDTTDPGLLTRNLDYFAALTERVNALPAGDLNRPDPPGLGFDQCVTSTRALTEGMRAFYTTCHEKAVRASVLERLETL